MYGKIKVDGEKVLFDILLSVSCLICIVWVYFVYGNNFVKIMFKLMVDKF